MIHTHLRNHSIGKWLLASHFIIGQLSLSKAKQLAQGHTANTGLQSQDLGCSRNHLYSVCCSTIARKALS